MSPEERCTLLKPFLTRELFRGAGESCTVHYSSARTIKPALCVCLIKSSRTAQGLAEFREQITVVLARDSVSSGSFSAEKRVGRFDRPAGNGV